MSLLHTGPGKGRYIIRAAADAAPLTAFLATIKDDPSVELIDTIGPRDQPHTAVVEITHDMARQLEQRFRNSNQLIIEPDRPLSLFD